MINVACFTILQVLANAETGSNINSIHIHLPADPALWPLGKSTRDYWVAKQELPDQNIRNNDFTSSKRVTNESSDGTATARYCTMAYFTLTLKNGEKLNRDWLIYSPSTGKVFCFFCLLFGKSKNNAFKNGFCQWDHGHRALRNHETDSDHCHSVQAWIGETSKTNKIDTLLKSEMEKEQRYWREVLHRVVECLKYLCERGLALRGATETIGDFENGNFLGALEFLAKFDPFMAKHLEKYGNKGSGHVSYISSTTYEEIVILMGKKVLQIISDEVQSSKYFALIVDSSPDVSHCDQLAVILRYVTTEGIIQERFVGYISSVGHSGECMEAAVLGVLQKLQIDIKNGRGQAYDNASNMSGRYKGLQARFKNINKYMDYVPCSAHSLNLVGVNTVENCQKASDLFSFLQQLYNFTASSTNRWKQVCGDLTSADERQVYLKSLSGTRWSARAVSSKVVFENYNKIYQSLLKITENQEEKKSTQDEAMALLKTMKSLDMAFMITFWYDILERFNATNIKLQDKSIHLSTASQLLMSLKSFVMSLREKFEHFKERARALSNEVNEKFDIEYSRIRKRKLASDESREGEVTLLGSEAFKVNNFIPLVDKLNLCLEDRLEAYVALEKKFQFLFNFKSMATEELLVAAENLASIYLDDFDGHFANEMVQFSKFIKDSDASSPEEYLQIIKKNKLESVFPNTCIAYRIYLTLPVSNCSAERAFSKMARVKNDFRASMTNERLNSLSLMSIERRLLREINFEDTVKEFAACKSRKKHF